MRKVERAARPGRGRPPASPSARWPQPLPLPLAGPWALGPRDARCEDRGPPAMGGWGRGHGLLPEGRVVTPEAGDLGLGLSVRSGCQEDVPSAVHHGKIFYQRNSSLKKSLRTNPDMARQNVYFYCPSGPLRRRGERAKARVAEREPWTSVLAAQEVGTGMQPVRGSGQLSSAAHTRAQTGGSRDAHARPRPWAGRPCLSPDDRPQTEGQTGRG